MELLQTVKEYESDTFSASGYNLTDAEAEKITEKIILDAIQDLIELKTLDGVMIDEWLDEFRQLKEEE